jgi:hypothetical protein
MACTDKSREFGIELEVAWLYIITIATFIIFIEFIVGFK